LGVQEVNIHSAAADASGLHCCGFNDYSSVSDCADAAVKQCVYD